MKRSVLFVISALMLVSLAACGEVPSHEKQLDDKRTVAGGIVPGAAFVKEVAGDKVNIVTMIPPGYSPENYQPSTAEMQALSDAAVYFSMQTPTEEVSILPKVAEFNPNARVVMLRDAAASKYPLLEASHHHHHDEDDDEDEHGDEDEHADEDAHEIDPHVWLSPRRVAVMVQAIADTLSELDPANRDEFQRNAESFIGRLDVLNTEIIGAVSRMDNKAFLIYHPAYTYFADDYGLDMIAIEMQGKKATAADLQAVIEKARENSIKTVFYQAEFDDNQAQTVAAEIGGTVAESAPLSYDYIQSLRDFMSALAGE